ncbi:MAG: DUF4124 domain-containing protein [Betaproteobacteria bacterium]
MSATVFRVFFVGALLCSFPLAASAQVHKWVDEKGGVHYGDQAPSARPSKTLQIPIRAADYPPVDATCQSDRCQYERMRADRLRAEDDRRQELVAGYDLQRRSAQSWNDLYATLAERDRAQRSEWDTFRFSPTPMDVRLQRDRVYSGPPSAGGFIVARPGWSGAGSSGQAASAASMSQSIRRR